MEQIADSCVYVTEQAWGEISPRAALFHVVLTADKLFSGRAAFEKAGELRKLVIALGERDIPDSAVALEGATLDVSTGLFTRSSSVRYRVRVQVKDVERVADVLDAITECKQARLTHIEWDYAGGASDELLATCATRAAAKAKHLAAALGVELAALRTVHEEHIDEPPPAMHLAMSDMMMARRKGSAGVADELAGLELAPTKRVGVRVRITYALAR